jgi:hypothetical protein
MRRVDPLAFPLVFGGILGDDVSDDHRGIVVDSKPVRCSNRSAF